MGERLKELREEKRLTQQELADKSGVSRPTIVALENGNEKNVLLGTLKKLAAALDVTVRIFFEAAA